MTNVKVAHTVHAAKSVGHVYTATIAADALFVSEDVLHIFEAFTAKKDVPEEAEQAIKEEVEKILAEAGKKFTEILDSHGLELCDIQHFIRRKS